MPNYAKDNEVLYHVGLSRNMLEGAEYVLLPGDPYRVESLAKTLDPNAKHLNCSREYTSYLADFNNNQKVLVCSTGMGGPSVGIGIEELAMLGLKQFIRVGTCGGIQDYTKVGDIIISKAAVRLEGTSTHYAPVEYPAVASFPLTNACIEAAKAAKVPYHVGITATSDTFWPGQERHDNYSGHLLRKFEGSMDEWKALNVLNFEMEVATLFVLCSAFGLDAAAICGVVVQRDMAEEIDLEGKKTAKKNWEKVIADSIAISMRDTTDKAA